MRNKEFVRPSSKIFGRIEPLGKKMVTGDEAWVFMSDQKIR
jgi:hypothetical protein